LCFFITDRFHNRQLPFKLEILKQRSSVIGLSVPNQKPDSCLPPLLNFTAILIIRFIKKDVMGWMSWHQCLSGDWLDRQTSLA